MYRMFMRARHIQRWVQYDLGLVSAVPSEAEARGMVPVDDFQEIDRFFYLPIGRY